MKKLLYITVNSKPEIISTSKTVGREFVNRFLALNPDYIIEELDLITDEIPEVNHRTITRRAETVSGVDYEKLSTQDKRDVDRITYLCNQFLSADTYVIAAPMWSLSFPARLKRYIDCIILNNRTIKITQKEAKGLLDDRVRNMIYIQTSGGEYPKLFAKKFNHGVDYLQDIFTSLGIKNFEKVLVEGVDMEVGNKNQAIQEAYRHIDTIIEKISEKELAKV